MTGALARVPVFPQEIRRPRVFRVAAAPIHITMSSSDIFWIIVGLGLIVAVWFAQSAGFSAGNYLKQRQRRRREGESQDDRGGYFRGKR